jgi:hypothetical protein
MPSTVTGLLAAADLRRDGVVDWGAMISIGKPGVYIVALTDDVGSASETVDECPISLGAIEELLRTRPELRLDGERPSVEALAARIAQFWLADETVLNVGLAGTSLRTRVNQYYNTPLGARRPHAGGYFLKVLANLNDLKVHFAACDDPDQAEDSMLGTFCKGVSEHTRQTLRDSEHPFPFANLEWPKGIRKDHGITGAKEGRISGSQRVASAMQVDEKSRDSAKREKRVDVTAINAFLQAELHKRGRGEVPAVEAARWLDEAGLLRDSDHRPGLPLRNLLREGQIRGQRQEPNGRWFIDRSDGF